MVFVALALVLCGVLISGSIDRFANMLCERLCHININDTTRVSGSCVLRYQTADGKWYEHKIDNGGRDETRK